jgi:hypothetical protein
MAFRTRSLARASLAASLLASALPSSARAQGAVAPTAAKPVGWSATANLSGVATSGNSSTRSLGGKLRLDRAWLRTFFFVEGGGVTQSADEGEIFALGTQNAFEIVDQRESEKKAESFFTEIGFERRMTERWFWTIGSGWRRDVFAGIDSQLSARGGFGFVAVGPRSEFKLGALATYTDQNDIVPDPELENPFFGGRFTLELLRKFGQGDRSAFKTFFALDQNFQTSEDTRVLWDSSLTVAINTRLALQVGYVLNWRNLPAYEEVPLFLVPPPAPSTGSVLRRLDEIDQTFQVSLVLNWTPRPPSAAKPTP